MINKKIRNATPNEYNGIAFKSKLEVMIYKTLQEFGFTPLYETVKYVIWKGYKPTIPYYTKDKFTGLLKKVDKKLIDITYTPDFEVFTDNCHAIIEVKGKINDIFPIKRKMFRKYLEDNPDYNNKPVIYFEIYSKKQLLQAIQIIKEYEQKN